MAQRVRERHGHRSRDLGQGDGQGMMIDAMTFGDLLTQMNIIDEMSTGKAVKERYLAASG